MKHRTLPLIAVLWCAMALTACGSPQSTPDATSTEAAIAARIFATLTASVPTPAPTTTTVPVSPTVPPTSTLVPSPTANPPAPTSTVLLPTPSPAPTARPSPTSTSEGVLATVQSVSVNVRAGPGIGHPVITVVKQGDRLPVTGRNGDSSWLEVTLSDGRNGWISVSLVQLSVSADKVAVARVMPTPPPAPAAAPAAVAKPATDMRNLLVSFINPHYECQQGEWEFRGDLRGIPGARFILWGYRSFQVDLWIKNLGNAPVTPPWQPKRWIITNGFAESMSDLTWQWGTTGSLYNQPTIQPGQSAGWTFLAFPLDRDQWVKAVEFVWNGQVYRQEFDLGSFGNAYNYKDCGDPRPHTFRPTPTPRP